MSQEQKTLAGSEPINPLAVEDTPQLPENSAEQTAKADPENTGTQQSKEDLVATLESRLKESQSMIGRQGSNIGTLKQELAALRAEIAEAKKTATGPSDEQALSEIYRQMDSGEVDIATGMQQALAINSKLTSRQVMEQVRKEQQRDKVSEVQQRFLKDNPDYPEVVESGALQPYLEADPLADEYAAFIKYKSDMRVAELEKAAAAKIAAAKEEGAKLARGAEAAGKVLGKQGSTATATPRPPGPWKNTQDATNAMLAKLQEMRGASAQ